MLAQHLITKPVFDALFDEYSFAAHNPMAQAMQKVLDVLDQHQLDSETEALQRFYDSVKLRASGIHCAEGKQKIIVELYDKFFRNAFPRMTERLGIVYTPVKVVDFIIHSVQHILQTEFGQTLGSKGVPATLLGGVRLNALGFLSGTPFGAPGAANLLRLAHAPAPNRRR